MNHLLSILAALCLLAAPAAAQTVKALAYNTNGQVVYTGTNTLTFTNSVNVASFSIRQGTNTYFYAGDDVVESYVSFSVYEAISFSGSNSAAATRINLGFSDNLNTFWTATNAASARSNLSLGAAWLTNTNVGTFRSDIGLPLAALTNTSSVTMMRALAGVTNGPITDSITLSDGGTSWTLTFSNGILVSITEL